MGYVRSTEIRQIRLSCGYVCFRKLWLPFLTFLKNKILYLQQLQVGPSTPYGTWRYHQERTFLPRSDATAFQ